MEIDYSKFSNEALKFVYTEADKLLGKTLGDFERIADKSFTAFAVYAGVIAFYFERLDSNLLFWIPFSTAIIAMAILFKNLMPTRMMNQGAKANLLISEYFASREDPHRAIAEFMVEEMDKNIEYNRAQSKIRMGRYRLSAIILVVGLILAGLGTLAGVR